MPASSPLPPSNEIAAHSRQPRATDYAKADAAALFFGETRVPVETIAVPNPDSAGLTAD